MQGLGYKWENDTIYYAIGLKNGNINNANFSVELPDEDWVLVYGKTDNLKEIYDEIYKNGKLKYEITADSTTCKLLKEQRSTLKSVNLHIRVYTALKAER